VERLKTIFTKNNQMEFPSVLDINPNDDCNALSIDINSSHGELSQQIEIKID